MGGGIVRRLEEILTVKYSSGLRSYPYRIVTINCYHNGDIKLWTLTWKVEGIFFVFLFPFKGLNNSGILQTLSSQNVWKNMMAEKTLVLQIGRSKVYLDRQEVFPWWMLSMSWSSSCHALRRSTISGSLPVEINIYSRPYTFSL